MASKATKEKDDQILQRLDTLIRLQGRIAVSQLPTQKDKIVFLSGAGLAPKEVGEILGVSANSVSVTLLAVRKAATKSAKSKPNGNEEVQA
jgi:DNA-binding CsgD family transcriptional regulator